MEAKERQAHGQTAPGKTLTAKLPEASKGESREKAGKLLNVAPRYVSAWQRTVLQLHKKEIIARRARENQSLAGGDKKSLLSKLTKAVQIETPLHTRKEIASKAKVAEGTVHKVEKILELGDPGGEVV